MERVNLQELPKDEKKLCRRWFETKFSFLWIPNTSALLTRHCCIFPNRKCTRLRHFCEPKFVSFSHRPGSFCSHPTAARDLFCIKCRSSQLLPSAFPPNVNSMQINSTCKWAAQWIWQNCPVIPVLWLEKNKAATLPACYPLSKTSVQHIVARFRITQLDHVLVLELT